MKGLLVSMYCYLETSRTSTRGGKEESKDRNIGLLVSHASILLPSFELSTVLDQAAVEQYPLGMQFTKQSFAFFFFFTDSRGATV